MPTNTSTKPTAADIAAAKRAIAAMVADSDRADLTRAAHRVVEGLDIFAISNGVK